MSRHSRMEADAACRAVVIEAARAVDAGDAAAFAALFCDDGVLVRPDGSRMQGPQAIAAAYAARDPDRLTRHLICNQLVRWSADGTRATVFSTVLLWTGRHSSPATPQGRVADAMSQVGEFEDLMALTLHGWRIQERQARFVLYRREA